MADFELPRVPASAGGLLRDRDGRLLVLKPTYKRGWTIPGGQIEADGESPWQACRREIREETGLSVITGRLVCVDFLRPRRARPGGLRFVFDCGSLGPAEQRRVVLPDDEIVEHRWAEPDEALRLLSGPVGRRVGLALDAEHTLYLEDGRLVPGVNGVPGR